MQATGSFATGSGAGYYYDSAVKKIYFGTNPIPIPTLKLGNIEIKEVWVGTVKVFST